MSRPTRQKPNSNLPAEVSLIRSDLPVGRASQTCYLTRFWDVQQLAGYLGVSKTWIYERTRRNGPELIPHFRLGKYLRFDPNSKGFQDWLKTHEITRSTSGDVSEASDQNQESKAHNSYNGSRLSDRASQKERRQR